jgi:hypothetical protein
LDVATSAADPELEAKKAANAEAVKKVDELEPQIRAAETKLATARRETPGKIAELQKVGRDIAAAIAGLNVDAAALAHGIKPHPLIDAVSAAQKAREQENTQLAAARADVQRWTRAEAFMSVHRAESRYAELKSRHEELVATAKDALLLADQIRGQIAELEKAVAEGPAKIKEAEAALAQVQAASAEQALAKLKQTVADNATQLAELKQKARQVIHSAKQSRTQAEQEAAAVSKDLEKSKADAQRIRADFDAKWRSATGLGTASYDAPR